MKSIKIFLSGSVEKIFQDLNIGKTYWNITDEEYLKNQLQFEIELLNPNTITINKYDREARFRADLSLLLKSDMMLVDGTDKKGLGVGAEMALAKNWGIPVFTIAPENSHYRKQEQGEVEWIHPFIFELSDNIFFNLDEFIDYLNELYQHNRLPNSVIDDPDDVLDRFNGFDGGYDEGYTVVENFWGKKPAKLVIKCAELLRNTHEKNIVCLDLGCGHGKNALYLKKQGFVVHAMDSSYYAINEAKKYCHDIKWKVRDIRKLYYNPTKYHAIIMTGCLHCLASYYEVRKVVQTAQELTYSGGYHVLSAFNSNVQDLSGHNIGFNPILLSHDEYLEMYKEWEIISAIDNVQDDIHLHNGIKHKHSITRILAKKK